MGVCLSLKLLGVGRPESFPFIDNPGKQSLTLASLNLTKMGALDDKGEVTAVGKAIHEFPLDPYSAFCLFNLLTEPDQLRHDVVTVIALLSQDSFFVPEGPASGRRLAENRGQWRVPMSDHLTKLNLFYRFVESKNKKEFCRHFGLKRKSLDNIALVRLQLLDILERMRLGHLASSTTRKNPSPHQALESIIPHFEFDRQGILRVLKKSFFTRLATLVGHGEYSIQGSALRAKIHPESVLFASREKPAQVLFHSLASTSRLYISNVSAVH